MEQERCPQCGFVVRTFSGPCDSCGFPLAKVAEKRNLEARLKCLRKDLTDIELRLKTAYHRKNKVENILGIPFFGGIAILFLAVFISACFNLSLGLEGLPDQVVSAFLVLFLISGVCVLFVNLAPGVRRLDSEHKDTVTRVKELERQIRDLGF